MPSKALFMLWIVYTTLPNYLLAGKEEDDADAIRFITLHAKNKAQVKNILLREMSDEGREFIHPDDPNKVLRIYKFPRRDDSITIGDEQGAIQKLMAKSDELGNQIPITQKLNRMLGFPYGHNWGISMEMERFRGNLLDGLYEDTALKASLEDFGARLEMYKQLAFAFQQMSALDIKHCNIEVHRVLYKKVGDDFSNIPLMETDTAFSFVMSDFRYVKDLGSPCKQGMASTWDHDDSQGSIPISGKCKGKIEIFGLGFLILKIETLALMVGQDGILPAKLRPQNIADALQTMPDAPDDISMYFTRKDAIMKKNTYDILDEIMNWNQFYNTGYEDIDNPVRVIDGKSLLTNLAYIEMANALTFEQKDLERHSSLADNAGVKDKVVGNYAAFNNLLQSMLKTNDYMNGRPDAGSTFTTLNKIQQAYVANIQWLNRDRILIV